MPATRDKYFWDGNENLSVGFRVRRMAEYAAFPDLINFPFGEFREGIALIDPETLRTSEKRRRFIALAKPYIAAANCWEEVIEKMIG